jgi:hypothetical protein
MVEFEVVSPIFGCDLGRKRSSFKTRAATFPNPMDSLKSKFFDLTRASVTRGGKGGEIPSKRRFEKRGSFLRESNFDFTFLKIKLKGGKK